MPTVARALAEQPCEVAERCAELAHERGQLRRLLARVAGRCLETRSWERLGFARLADYGRERVGLTASALRDLARVDVRLGELPAVEAGLLEGRISWTKARLLGQVARSEDEALWVCFAEGATVRSLARQVRCVDAGSLDAGSPELTEERELSTRETARIRCSPRVRAKWYSVRQLAQRVAGERLEPEQVLEQLTAEVLSAVPLGPESEEVELPRPRASGRSRLRVLDAPLRRSPFDLALRRVEAEGADALPRASLESRMPPSLRPFVDGLEHAGSFELDRRLRALVLAEQRLDAGIGALLARVARERGYRSAGLPSLEAFARERLGISPRKARALLRLERAVRVCPELGRAYRTGELSWVQAQTLLPILVLDDGERWRSGWIAWAGRVSVRRLEDDVERALVMRETEPSAWRASGGLPSADAGPGWSHTSDRENSDRQTCDDPTVSDRPPVPASSPSCAQREDAHLFVTAPCEVTRLFRATLCTVRRRIELLTGRSASEGAGFEAMLDHVMETWGRTDPSASEKRRHRVFERDGWRCTVPGCSSFRNLHAHHVRFRSAGGSDALSNRVSLCAWHHLRGVHAGIVRVTGSAPGRLRFDLGLRAGQEPLVSYRSGDRRLHQPRTRSCQTMRLV
jgi:hypothetical protein